MISSKRIILFTALLVLLSGLVLLELGCQRGEEKPLGEPVIFENHEFGIRWIFPAEWPEEYLVEAKEQCIMVSFGATPDVERFVLFVVDRYVGEGIREEDVKHMDETSYVLGKSGGHTFVVTKPEVQGGPDLYWEMAKMVPMVLESMQLLEPERPKVLNPGNQKAGTVFFTMEIPENWSLKQPEEDSMYWLMLDEGTETGSLVFVPYHTSMEDFGLFEGDGRLHGILADPSSGRKVWISLEGNGGNKEILDVVTQTFEFLKGPVTAVDQLSHAHRLVEANGGVFFGLLEEARGGSDNEIELGIRRAVFVEDDSEPNGFRLEDMAETIEWFPTLDALAIPLGMPNYTNSGMYGWMNLPLFLETYDLGYLYYDFFVDENGVIRYLVGRYIP